MEMKQLRKLVGAMTWVAEQTRPDVAAEVSMIQSASPQATAGQIARANKIARRLKATEGQELVFENLKGHRGILVFTDAALRNAIEGEDMARSQCGYVIVKVETNQGKLEKRARFNVMAWGSNKIRRVCRSSFGAEALAACATADAGYVARLGVEEVRGASVETYLVANNVSEKEIVGGACAAHMVEKTPSTDTLGCEARYPPEATQVPNTQSLSAQLPPSHRSPHDILNWSLPPIGNVNRLRLRQ